MSSSIDHNNFVSSLSYKKTDEDGYYNASAGEEIIMAQPLNGIRIISPDGTIQIKINNDDYALVPKNIPLGISKLKIVKLTPKEDCRFYFDGLTY